MAYPYTIAYRCGHNYKRRYKRRDGLALYGGVRNAAPKAAIFLGKHATDGFSPASKPHVETS